MPTKNPRFTVALPAPLLEAVNEYQHSHRFATQNKAINELLQKGLLACELETCDVPTVDSSELSREALALAALYDRLDPHSQQAVRMLAEHESKRTDEDDIIVQNVVMPLSEMLPHIVHSNLESNSSSVSKQRK